MILALNMRIIDYHEDVKRGKWQESRDFCFLDYPIHELEGRTLGIIGYGDLGRNVEKIARAFGMEVLLADHKGLTDVREGRTPFDEVIEKADVITLHCPLTDKTQDLITMDEMRVMDDNAILINTARGGIVNEADLAQALRDGVIGGAGVDVLSKEPPSDGNPLLDSTIPNLVMSPHTAWASLQARQRMFDQIVEVIQAYRAGSPINVVS
jgi:glycerate dehydrogenase